ncbi:hypothetical protein C7M61_005286 [Candidozyma pseudohaemuli]|uniref:Ubiquitin-like domain-containing protein n=1 Tax=Candidozyma pseudohaemuli TaxID=418784 RepID=A0A2P7YBS4_9ASCO|nr:hypothetical protein C7M61_005286 [[Candida] pseudohaemulonii]PSK33418.1 hypothetical protein C7M61_005286 [[Candida] pseudohaemulonii]
MQLASHLYLVSCVLLLVVIAESVTLEDHLNITLASVEKCNKELNVTATVFVKNDRQVLIQLPAENNSSISSDETEERYIECLQNISELTTFTIFEDSPEVFSESHECQLSDATTWLERNGIDDPVVALPLDDMKVLIVVRFTDSVSGELMPDLELPFTINFDRDDVNTLVSSMWLKEQIRTQREGTERRRIRLIYNGRVLNELTNFRDDIFVPKLRLMEVDEQLKIYIHCLVGETLTGSQLSEERELDRRPQQVSTAPQVVGFDRLLQQGFSQEDVNDLRRQFRDVYLPDALQNLNAGDVTDIEEEEARQQLIRQLEERWIESTINGNTANTTVSAGADDDTGVIAPTVRASAELEESNRNEDIVVGMLIGAFLGVVALVFEVLDDSYMSKDRRWAVFAGVMMNVMYAILRGQWL